MKWNEILIFYKFHKKCIFNILPEPESSLFHPCRCTVLGSRCRSSSHCRHGRPSPACCGKGWGSCVSSGWWGNRRNPRNQNHRCNWWDISPLPRSWQTSLSQLWQQFGQSVIHYYQLTSLYLALQASFVFQNSCRAELQVISMSWCWCWWTYLASDTIMLRIRKIKDLSFSLIIAGKLGQVLFWFRSQP